VLPGTAASPWENRRRVFMGFSGFHL